MSIKGREGRLAATKYDLAAQGIEFVERNYLNAMPQNLWLRAYGSQVYVRIYPHPIKGVCFDIANIDIRRENQRQGIFRHFLSEMERICWSYGVQWIKIENVFNPGLASFCRKRGYQEMRDEGNLLSFWFHIMKGPPIV